MTTTWTEVQCWHCGGHGLLQLLRSRRQRLSRRHRMPHMQRLRARVPVGAWRSCPMAGRSIPGTGAGGRHRLNVGADLFGFGI
jgi:hypothetical protein